MKLIQTTLLIAISGFGFIGAVTDQVAPVHQRTQASPQMVQPTDTSKFPDWLVALYPSEQELTGFEILNDSLSYCTYEQTVDGVCQLEYLATYVNREIKDSLEIGRHCDHEQSWPTYTWKEHAISSPGRIRIAEYAESVNDSLIGIDGWMKPGYDFSEAETTVDSIIQTFQVDHRGRIIPKDFPRISHGFSIDQLTNKVFDYGSKTHLTDTCSFYFECDCCSAEMMFFRDSSFYMLDYCESDVTLSHGTYEISQTHVELHFSGHCTTKAYNWEYEVGNSTIRYLFKDTIVEARSFQFNSLLCNDKAFFEAASEALIETDKSTQEFMGKIEEVKAGKE